MNGLKLETDTVHIYKQLDLKILATWSVNSRASEFLAIFIEIDFANFFFSSLHLNHLSYSATLKYLYPKVK